MSELYRPAGTTASGPYTVAIDPATAGWEWSGLWVVQLAPGGSVTFATRGNEMIVLPLAGSCDVDVSVETGPSKGVNELRLAGRRSVFSRVTDFGYVPRDAEVTVSSATGGRFAFPSARCERRLPVRYGPAEDVPVELRGAGTASRQVNNFATPESFDCDRLIACEVLTPAGNWSSYPPHKHDTDRPGESVLEEIYYFEVGEGPEGPGIAYQRVYGTPDRPGDLLAEVRDGDVVLIPHGWHGPSMAPPGYDLYYLNVMAGPQQERAWRICDDPAHAWVRGTWADQPMDPRLPLTGTAERPVPGAEPTEPGEQPPPVRSAADGEAAAGSAR